MRRSTKRFVFEAQDIPLDIVYEDDDILVINKPRDLVVHPGAGNPDGTVLNALLHYYPPIADVPRAGIVHRLDKDTTGLMVVAKTVSGANAPGGVFAAARDHPRI
ncbi:ftsH suppressor protein SfhB [Salmonella sp. NCTC 11881]|nr:ftsH suppressor protein SfhB [Salmonella sp. NCTC 11881]